MRITPVRLLVLAALLLPLPALAQEGGPQAISLDDAVRQAVAHSPLVVQALGQSRIANSSLRTAIGAFLPNLTFGQYAGHTQGTVYVQGVLFPTQPGWTYSRGYGANMTLFNGGGNFLDYRAARASLEAADQNQVIQRFAVSLSVKQQYFAVLAGREALAAAQDQLKEANEQMAVTQARLAGGALSRADSLASAVAVGQARVALATAQGSVVAANTALTQLVGVSHEVTAEVADTALVPQISIDSAQLVALALAGPAVRQAQQQVDANRSTWWSALTGYLPDLTVSFSHNTNYTNPNLIVGGGNHSGTNAMSFYLSYNLFNNFAREARVTTADVNRDNALAQFRDARLGAREKLEQYLSQFRTAQTRIQLQELTIESATQNVESKDAQYRAGAVPLVDVLTQQAALATARQGLIQARLDARTAKAQIEALIGRNLD